MIRFTRALQSKSPHDWLIADFDLNGWPGPMANCKLENRLLVGLEEGLIFLLPRCRFENFPNVIKHVYIVTVLCR